MSDDEITPQEFRESVADVGRLELHFLNIQQEVFDRGFELMELHDLLTSKLNTGGELFVNKDQTKLVFLAVRFASLFRTLHHANEQIKKTIEG